MSMVDININTSIITLSINDLNTLIKGHKLSEWIKKQDPTICYLQEIYFKHKDINRLKLKRWRDISHANTNQQKLGVAIVISDRADFSTRKVMRDKEGIT